MSPILGANQLGYDMKMDIMEKNEGKEVAFQIEDGTQYYGKISYVPNSEHYCVVIDNKGTPWEWYVREEAVRFVENTATDIWDTEGGKNLWQNPSV
jgi:hypothetical protein